MNPDLFAGGPAPLPPTTIIAVLAVWNVFALFVMRHDKKAAKAGSRRVPERTLLLLAFAMGGPGIWLGMRLFRHKTQHLKFIVLVPVAFLVNLIVFRLLGNM